MDEDRWKFYSPKASVAHLYDPENPTVAACGRVAKGVVPFYPPAYTVFCNRCMPLADRGGYPYYTPDPLRFQLEELVAEWKEKSSRCSTRESIHAYKTAAEELERLL